MEYSGAGGKLIHEKNQKQKSLDTVPLKQHFKFFSFKHKLEDLSFMDLEPIPEKVFFFFKSFFYTF